MIRRLAPLTAVLLLAACGRAEDTDPGGISAGEAQELNEAAAMLDANAVELNQVTGNEVTP
ncbi:hypothetical protein SAMN06297144_1339 [Sphingomonas guangdongensis]|uniref:Uncharacterized protein n=1 Tax=Sphingomonas guangdongensis TaxID=1141890 RepID=A0A285QLM4_9SPHN|nr:hypothetical protein [Sphingomonas guangdongensis]SOB80992.1 hypothetical protein SAMN06297144_1339 [Sphingomonas guangdongensis]